MGTEPSSVFPLVHFDDVALTHLFQDSHIQIPANEKISKRSRVHPSTKARTSKLLIYFPHSASARMKFYGHFKHKRGQKIQSLVWWAEALLKISWKKELEDIGGH